MPSIPNLQEIPMVYFEVLNLIITGMPSILMIAIIGMTMKDYLSFKPYYNWNAFNTLDFSRVLNSWLFSSFFNPRNIWPKSRNLSTFLFFVLNIYYFFLKKTQKITNFSFNTNRKVKC